MAIIIIQTDDDGKQVKTHIKVDIQDEDWEENCYQVGCRVARAVAKGYLESKEEQILKERPAVFRVKDIRERILVTRFGDITFRRRLYQHKQGA